MAGAAHGPRVSLEIHLPIAQAGPAPACAPDAAMSRSQSLALAAAYFDDGRFLSDLERRVACPTESDGGTVPPSLAQYLRDEMAPTLTPLGFDCQILQNPSPRGGPLLIARRVEDPALPTVLTYGHGDVVNGQVGKWRAGLAPWRVTVEDGKWYGRGTADNKGQHTVNLGGLAAAIAARDGKLGYNVTVLIETGEEAGSPGLNDFCAAQAQALEAELFIGCDGPRVRADLPTLFLGSRGMVNFTLSLRCRERAYHSGNWGGVITNPATVLANALASMVDARGVLGVEGLRAPAVTDAVRAALDGLPIGGDVNDPALDPAWGEPGMTPAERLVAWNTLEVLALGAGSAERPVNAIPPVAVAHCQLRFVVGTDWTNLARHLRRHLDERGFQAIDIDVTMQTAATRLDVEHPWVRWAQGSLAGTTGNAPAVMPNLAGSLPNDAFADVLGLPTLWVPHSYPACAQHGPDEHLLPAIAREGLQIMAGLYWDLGEAGAPWRA